MKSVSGRPVANNRMFGILGIPDLPDSLGGPPCADGEFALIFVAAELAFDGHMPAFGEGAGEIGAAEADKSKVLYRECAWPSSVEREIKPEGRRIPDTTLITYRY